MVHIGSAREIRNAADNWKAMDIRIIKSEDHYRKALEEIAHLAEKDPARESGEGARLELLAKLVEDYEKEKFVFNHPDPIDAIIFRMEEQGLRQSVYAGRPRPISRR